MQSDQCLLFHCLDSITPIVTETSRLELASVAEQSGLSPAWSDTPEDRFSHVTRLTCIIKSQVVTDHFIALVNSFVNELQGEGHCTYFHTWYSLFSVFILPFMILSKTK